MTAPTGTTQLTAVIGSPVRHSLSPTLHNAAFAAAGLDWVMLAFEVAPRIRRGRRRRDADVRSARPGGHDAAQVRRRGGGRRGRSGGRRARIGQHRRPARRRHDVRHQHRRRRVRRVVAGAWDRSGRSTGRVARRRCGGPGGHRRARAGRRRRPGDREPHRRRRRPRRPSWRRRLASATSTTSATPTSWSTPRRSGWAPTSCRATRRSSVRTRSSPISSTTRWRPRCCEPRVTPERSPSTGSAMLVHQAVLQHELWTGDRPDPAVMRAATEGELSRRHG